MKLTDNKKLFEQVTVEQFRQNLVLLQAKEIEIPRTWVLELLDTIESLQQENRQLRGVLEMAKDALDNGLFWTKRYEHDASSEQIQEAIETIDKVLGVKR